MITHADILFSADSPMQIPTLPPRPEGATQPVDNNPTPGSSRTKIQILKPGADGKAARTPKTVVRSPTLEHDQLLMPLPTFTRDEELDLLFDPALIPQSMRDAAGDAYHVRPLASTDLMRSHFGLLQTLTVSPPIAPSMYKSLFAHIKSCPDTYYIMVIIDRSTDQMVAHGAVVLEKKYIHGGSIAGHLEDIVVSPSTRGTGMGKTLVVGLRDLAVERGAYKIILGCKESRVRECSAPLE